MVAYLENHGPDKFAQIFLGEYDTPEVKIFYRTCNVLFQLEGFSYVFYKWKNLPHVFMLWVKTAVLSKQVGDFFKFWDLLITALQLTYNSLSIVGSQSTWFINFFNHRPFGTMRCELLWFKKSPTIWRIFRRGWNPTCAPSTSTVPSPWSPTRGWRTSCSATSTICATCATTPSSPTGPFLTHSNYSGKWSFWWMTFLCK